MDWRRRIRRISVSYYVKCQNIGIMFTNLDDQCGTRLLRIGHFTRNKIEPLWEGESLRTWLLQVQTRAQPPAVILRPPPILHLHLRSRILSKDPQITIPNRILKRSECPTINDQVRPGTRSRGHLASVWCLRPGRPRPWRAPCPRGWTWTTTSPWRTTAPRTGAGGASLTSSRALDQLQLGQSPQTRQLAQDCSWLQIETWTL